MRSTKIRRSWRWEVECILLNAELDVCIVNWFLVLLFGVFGERDKVRPQYHFLPGVTLCTHSNLVLEMKAQWNKVVCSLALGYCFRLISRDILPLISALPVCLAPWIVEGVRLSRLLGSSWTLAPENPKPDFISVVLTFVWL